MENQNNSENLKYIKIIFYEKDRCLIQADPHTKIYSSLFCDLKKKLIIPKTNSKSLGMETSFNYYSYFIGIVQLEENNYFLFAKNVLFKGKIKNFNIYEIVTIDYLSFDNSQKKSKYITDKLNLIINHFSKGFYFSYDMKLSDSLIKDRSFRNDFFCNKNLLSFLNLHDSLISWKIPLIKGYFKSHQIIHDGNSDSFSILCKINYEGFLEINIIFESGDNIEIKVFFFGNLRHYFIDKINDISSNRKILILSMLKLEKEKVIKKNKFFEEEIKLSVEKNKTIKYKFISEDYFNLNSLNKIIKNESLFKEFLEISDHFSSTKYGRNNFIENKQKGYYLFVFNDIILYNTQIIFFILFYKFILQKINFKIYDANFIKLFYEVISEFFSSLYLHLNDNPKNKFQNMGFKNNLKINLKNRNNEIFTELIYSSNFKYFTKIKKDLLVNSLILNNSLSPKKNKKKKFKTNVKFEPIKSLLKNPKTVNQSSLSFLLVTFNVSGKNPFLNSYKWKLFFEKIINTNSDIVYIALQEVFELKISFNNIKYFFNNEDLIKNWREIFERKLKNYILILCQNLKGLLTIIFVKEKHIDKLIIKSKFNVKLGIMKMGNKGAICTRIKFFNKNIRFINSHLAAGFGNKKRSKRLFDLDNILIANNLNLKKNKDLVFFLGDLNFKINMEKQKVLKILNKNTKNYERLKEYDELFHVLKFHTILENFKEHKINFSPSYKYDLKTMYFDSSEKIPSWTDRILFKKNDSINILEYGNIDIYVSDHKPVYLNFKINF